MNNGKSEWREKVKGLLGEISPEERAAKGQKISSYILEFLLIPLLTASKKDKRNFILGGFAPLKDEPSWYCGLHGHENHFAFPSSGGDEGGNRMAFYRARPEDLVACQGFGVKILGPDRGSSPLVVPDVLLVPGLAFSRKGERLGRGKGYYDRYLENFQGPTCGICFSEQIFLNLPVDPHDQKVDWIITEKEVIRVKDILSSIG